MSKAGSLSLLEGELALEMCSVPRWRTESWCMGLYSALGKAMEGSLSPGIYVKKGEVLRKG